MELDASFIFRCLLSLLDYTLSLPNGTALVLAPATALCYNYKQTQI